ncbi:MAG: CoA-binding protein [Candidatus Thorarchaeota archaeon]|nr:CoA-binding protein [Candidatus Thorarchaeota archaeon]
MKWKNESLDKLFNPRSIAVVGASDKSDKLGALSLIALRDYKGNVYPVNPRLKTIGDLKCYPSIGDIGEQVDLAMIALGPQYILPTLSECAKVGVKGAIIFSAGFKELGGIGEEHQRKVKEVADAGHIAVIGPNCLGAGNSNINLNATFFPHPAPMKGGSVAMVSQSGGVTGLMIYRAADSDLGISKFASVGNRVNIDFHDMLKYLREDSETEVICLFVEGTEYAREMTEEMKKTTPEKPVIVFKVGKTPASREAALSHTGSLAGNADLYSAAIKQSGAIEAAGVSEMVDTARILTICKHRPIGRRVAVVTHTLGIALIAAQTLELNGINLPLPSKDVADRIQSMLNMPVEVTIKNPIDLLAQGWANPKIFAEAFKLILKEDQFDAVMIVFSPNYQEGIGGGVPLEEIIQATRQVSKPVVSVLASPDSNKPPGHEILEASGIPFFSSPQRAAQALANLLNLSKSLR